MTLSMRPTTNVYFMYHFLWVPLVGLLSVIVAFSCNIIFLLQDSNMVTTVSKTLVQLTSPTKRTIKFEHLTRLNVALK